MKKKTLYAGAGLALAFGLLLGFALRPRFEAVDLPAQPQGYADWSGRQTPAPFDDPISYAGFMSRTPDYVIGTDSRRMLTAAATPPPEEQNTYESPIRDDRTDPAPVTVHLQALPAEGAAGAERAAYPLTAPPSADDAAKDAAAQAPAEPAPPALAVQDDEVTPEATGDTRIGQ